MCGRVSSGGFRLFIIWIEMNRDFTLHTLEQVKNIDQALREIRRVCKKRQMIVVPCEKKYRCTFDLHIHFFPYE
jgi:ubiquinone/menaquinone biosynthesis C-methylase UbiE